MMESASAEWYCNIHTERQSSSNSISGFQSGGSSKPFAAVRAGLSVQLEPQDKNHTSKKKRDDQRRGCSRAGAAGDQGSFPHKAPGKVDLLRVRKGVEEGEKPSRGDAGRTGSWRREGPLLPPSHRLFPARLTHGKRQKLRRRDTPQLHTHAHAPLADLSHVTAETSRLGCCPDKPARNDVD